MQVAVYVTVKDPGAPVYFYINDKKLDESSFRYTHTNNKGEHTLIIKKLELTDAGTLEVKTPLNKGEIATLTMNIGVNILVILVTQGTAC